MSISDDYVGKVLPPYQMRAEIKRAVPKLSDYRERFKKKRLTISDVVAPPSRRKLRNRANDVKAQFPGMVFGEGLEEEF